MVKSEFYGATDDTQSHRTMARALSLGGHFFDSADIYGLGHNVTLIGQFLKAGGAGHLRRAGHHICCLQSAGPRVFHRRSREGEPAYG